MNNHEFDKFARDYRNINDNALKLTGESSEFFAKYKADKLAEWFPEKIGKPLNMLDFGCGDGVMTSFVQYIFPKAKMYGVDPSSESIEVAQENFPHMTFSVSDSIYINFPDNFFDMIYAAAVYHHIPFEEHEAYTKELMRILKPGGTFVLFELNPLNPATRYIFKRNPIDEHATMLSKRYAVNLFSSYGTVKTNYYGFFPKILNVMRPVEKFLTKLPVGALYACLVEKY